MQGYHSVRFGSVRPEGFLKQYMEEDLHGFVGNLDRLVPDLFPGKDDIYGKDRRKEAEERVTIEDLGVVIDNPGMNAQLTWWNAESQGNWLDGFVRTAFLVDDPEMKEKARAYLKHYTDTQDEDGYFGIYGPSLRYRTGNENGELWAQTTVLRAFLAYYEATNDEEALAFVRRAVDCTMRHFRIDDPGCRPYGMENEPEDSYCTGVGHGLTFTDICRSLTELTGEQKYAEYGAWLYDRFNLEDGENLDRDVLRRTLLDPAFRMHAHACHTYEQVRALILSCEVTGSEEDKEALARYWERVEANCFCPSGGVIGDESIAPDGYDPSVTAYEYCGLTEMTDSLFTMLAWSGDLHYAELAERLVYNAAMGAHREEESAITYCKSDNCYSLIGDFQSEQPHSSYNDFIQTRFKYSPAHQDVAVCCVPNAGRIIPRFLTGMILSDDEGFFKTVYGPMVFCGTYEKTDVTIREESEFPFYGQIRYSVKAAAPVTFVLKLRMPEWADGYELRGASGSEENGLIVIRQTWSGTTNFSLRFSFRPIIRKDRLGDLYVTAAAAVLCLPIASESETVRTYDDPRFRDLYYQPAEEVPRLSLCGGEEPEVSDEVNFTVRAAFIGQDGDKTVRLLIPMRNTILRRVTFPAAGQKGEDR